MGIERYTWAALDNLDRRLVTLLDGKRHGSFVELGANDGLQQSNTLALETLMDWRGLLVEADPELAAECRRNRPLATVVCAAAGPGWGMAHLDPRDLTSAVGLDRAGGEVLVTTAPLSSLIDAADLSGPIDVLSVDVEGFELEILAGLDLSRHAPCHLLVETLRPVEVSRALGPGYQHAGAWSRHDHLYSRLDAGGPAR